MCGVAVLVTVLTVRAALLVPGLYSFSVVVGLCMLVTGAAMVVLAWYFDDQDGTFQPRWDRDTAPPVGGRGAAGAMGLAELANRWPQPVITVLLSFVTFLGPAAFDPPAPSGATRSPRATRRKPRPKFRLRRSRRSARSGNRRSIHPHRIPQRRSRCRS